jgi:hypothetical protein
MAQKRTVRYAIVATLNSDINSRQLQLQDIKAAFDDAVAAVTAAGGTNPIVVEVNASEIWPVGKPSVVGSLS